VRRENILLVASHVGSYLPQGISHAGSSEPNQVIPLLGSLTMQLSLAYWVLADAKRREKSLCWDYDTFVFFAYPIVIPIYLIQTRRFAAIKTLGLYLLLYLIAEGTYYVAFEATFYLKYCTS